MRSVVLVFIISLVTLSCVVLSFNELDFNSKTSNFSVDLLYHTIIYSNRDVIISPYIIWYLLMSVAYETLGVTREQISEVLFITEGRDSAVTKFKKLKNSVLVNRAGFKGVLGISLLNFLFYDEHFNVYSESVRRLENDFGFITQRLAFEEPVEVAHAALQTLREYDIPVNNFIQAEDFVNSTMVMCNYLEFGAKWYRAFNPSTVQQFYQDGDERRKTKIMMYTKSFFRHSNFENLQATITELPYEGEMYCMLLIRPHSGHDLEHVFRNLRGVPLKDIFAKLQSDTEEIGLREVAVKLPLGDISSRVILNGPLFSMGLSGFFDRDLANFRNFSKDQIYIGEFTHRVTVTFSQSLTLVRSTTPAYATNRIAAKEIAAEDPFIFLIIEKSTSTILIGGIHSKIGLY